MMERHIAEIKKLLLDYPQLNHASNIITKYESELNEKGRSALDSLIPRYVQYLKGVVYNRGLDTDGVVEKVRLLNNYYNYMHNNNLDNVFSSQSKFRSTILEEFMFLLFRGFVEKMKKSYDENGMLSSGNVKAYSNLYFKANSFADFIKQPIIGVNEKDQDYAIFRKFDVTIDGGEIRQIQIPAIAIEVKTYIDKTMLDSIIATAEKLKNGNPHTRFVVVAERYDVSFSVDPAYSRIDQIYVLRKGVRKKEWKNIDAEVVCRLYNETIRHLERPWSDVEKRLLEDGVII